MSRGYYDWLTDTEAISQHPMNIAEMAARFGVRDYLSKTGLLFDYSHFDIDLDGWLSGVGGNGEIVEHINNIKMLGVGCVHINTPAISGSAAQIQKTTTYPGNSTFGLATVLQANVADGIITMTANIRSGSIQIAAVVRLDLADNLIQISDNAGSFETVMDASDFVKFGIGSPMFIKLTYDIYNNSYIRIQYNNFVKGISDISGKVTNTTAAPQIIRIIAFNGVVASPLNLYIDSCFTTVNETPI